MKNTKRTVVGVFADRQQAQRAVEDLRRAGFRDDQIGVVARDTGGTTGTKTEAQGSHVGTGAAVGAAAGAGVGALWAIGIAAGMLPAIGPIIAGGIFASILASAAGGAAAGGLVGALIGLGIPEEEAKYYETEFHGGRTIVTVKADGRYDEAWSILHRQGAYNRTTAAQAPAAAGAVMQGAGEQTVRLHEEKLEAHKQPVETGEVKVRKEVVTEHKTLEVPVQREEVVIERHPAAGQASSADIRPGEEVRVPVREEQVDVSKRAVAKEEVRVGKRKVQDTEKVSGEVRKEELRVEREGNVDVHGSSADAGKKGRRKRK
jgi:uncharacterized protein (TIGR02271 family)